MREASSIPTRPAGEDSKLNVVVLSPTDANYINVEEMVCNLCIYVHTQLHMYIRTVNTR